MREQLRPVAPALLSSTPSLGRLLGYFLRLGTLGFGGPIAPCASMQRDLVETRGWFAREDHAEGLALAQLAPGPLGSGLAIVPFLYGGVVERVHWLTERQFLDAVAVAMITPGPLGAAVAALGVFLPCYLFVVVLAASFRRLVANAGVRAFVAGVTAAATGAIAGAAVVLGRRAIVDAPTAAIALVVLGSGRRLPEPALILAAGAAGLVLKGA